MGKRLNLIGQKFGRLLVLEFAGIRNYRTFFLCRCECGKEKIIMGKSIINGKTKSCGCLIKEVMKNNFFGVTHGKHNTIFYKKWGGIKTRCLNKKNHTYKNYGGRGIKICDKWLKFEGFYDDMYDNEDPSKSYIKHCEKFGENNTTLDRIDNNKGYCKENCRWSTSKEQANNRRNNRLIVYQGKRQTIAEWAKELNIKPSLISDRIKRGWKIEKVFNTPINFYKKYITFKNQTHTLGEWEKILKIKPNYLYDRVNRKGWKIKKAIETPIRKWISKK